ncbi:growth arrest and DNA damage-inducible proteins-interacting protein 1 [Pyrgilauda ruficollis]|uniref:growth arrest and DNA damage-inducible proteins-interacting protein 1 n=1 Tax=Pyrgilauda ruficollis TaxID=221976 RepID=UPI001B861EEF|nr:growth arrest and DNA damage-inducible proteins-interacting protein 1 [Pyrgilauda ruficollis]
MAAPLRRALLALGPARSRLPEPVPVPTRLYRADPLRRRPGPAPADPGDLRAAARRFGRLGEAAGVPVWRLWPSPEQLREAEAEEREWDPPLREVEAVLDQREREEERRRKEREERQARSLAAMPARVAEWRRERAAARERPALLRATTDPRDPQPRHPLTPRTPAPGPLAQLTPERDPHPGTL